MIFNTYSLHNPFLFLETLSPISPTRNIPIISSDGNTTGRQISHIYNVKAEAGGQHNAPQAPDDTQRVHYINY